MNSSLAQDAPTYPQHKATSKRRKPKRKRNPFGGFLLTDDRISAYAEAAGIDFWRGPKGIAKAAALIDIGIRRPLKHKMQDDGESIPIPNKWWGEFSALQREELQNKIFQCTNKFNETGTTCMAWRLNRKIRQRALDMNIKARANSKLIDAGTGRAVSIAKPSRDGAKIANIAQFVPVNVRALAAGIAVMPEWRAFYQNDMKGVEPAIYRAEMKVDKRRVDKRWSPDVKRAMLEYCERAELEMQSFLDHATSSGSGMIYQGYRQADSGRQYAIGLSLQSCTILAASTALLGCHQYDFESCHPTIALQLSEKWHECPPLESLKLAVANKKGIRDLIVTQTGCTLSAAKAALIMPMYGATHTQWSKGAYIQTLARKGYRRILRSKFFRRYEEDVQEFHKHLLNNCKRDEVTLQVENCHKIKAPLGANMKYEAAHLMQGFESWSMTAAATQATSAIVWKHDAIISSQPESIEQMTAAVKLATGFDLKIEHKQFTVSGLEAFQNDAK